MTKTVYIFFVCRKSSKKDSMISDDFVCPLFWHSSC